MIERERGIGSGGAFGWFFQRISGAVLLIVLIIHFWVLHFFPSQQGEVTFDIVMQRLQHPVWRAIDLLFLVVGLYHGMNGLLLVIHDYIRWPLPRIILVGTVWMIALFLLIMGSMTILGLSGRVV